MSEHQHDMVQHRYVQVRNDESSKDFQKPKTKDKIFFKTSIVSLTKHARSSFTFPQMNNSVRAELNLTASAMLQSPSPLILFERISRLQR